MAFLRIKEGLVGAFKVCENQRYIVKDNSIKLSAGHHRARRLSEEMPYSTVFTGVFVRRP